MGQITHEGADDISSWLAAIVQSCDDAIISKDLNGIFMTWNKAAEQIFGYKPDEAIGRPATILIPPDRLDEETVILETIRSGKPVTHLETVRLRKDGSLVDISLTVSPVRNQAGRIIGASKIVRDISQRKRREERIILLARDSEHRTKNILASVQAIIRLSDGDTVANLKQVIEKRIQALANVHGALIETQWRGADVRRLAKDEIEVYCQAGDGRANLNGPDLVLASDAAQVMAMVFHELATNAAKYGALSVPEGRVHVEWTRLTDKLLLTWTETGGPSVARPRHRGFGTRAMQRLISGQLHGDMRLDWRVEGLGCEIILPVDETECAY